MQSFSIETNHESPFEIHYYFYEGEEQTRDNPAWPDEVEIDHISMYGFTLTPEQEKAFIDHYGRDDLENFCLEDAYEQFRSLQEGYAEQAYDAWKESLKECPF
jgi:hypothetical protein